MNGQSCAAGNRSASTPRSRSRRASPTTGCSPRSSGAASRGDGRRRGTAAPPSRHCPPIAPRLPCPCRSSQPVAVLYADDAADGAPASPSSWPEAIQILGRHASSISRTSPRRAREVMRRSMPAAAFAPASKPGPWRTHQRTAVGPLLVSEIKLYNEAAVQVGRQKRDCSSAEAGDRAGPAALFAAHLEDR